MIGEREAAWHAGSGHFGETYGPANDGVRDPRRARSRQDDPRERNFRADGYLLGSYRIATAPEPNSSRLTSLKSTCLDNPANNVGP
jgi:hypothetical protein